MTEVINYSAFPVKNRNERIAEKSANGVVIDSGWIPRSLMTNDQKIVYDAFNNEMPKFGIRGSFANSERRYPLWKAHVTLFGKHPKYTWQQTGSCVGAGGDNLLKTGHALETLINGVSPSRFFEIWWLYIYGRSRFHAGLRGQGDGSWEGAWQKALLEDGFFEHDPVGAPDLPDPVERSGWLVQDDSIEYQWSDGAKIKQVWIDIGRKKLYRTSARLKSADEVIAALINGYPVAQASMFGFSPMVPRPQGNPPVRLVENWNASWSHKTWFDEYWDHPSVGEIVRFGNNWGPTAHGTPTGDEPNGGVYITKKVLQQICSDRDSEIIAYSPHDGFPAREEKINYGAF